MSASDETAFDFSSLAPREIPVVGPDGARYVLREASADAAIRYRELNLRARRLEDGKLVGWTGEMVQSDVVLVAHCLYRTDAAGNRTGVTVPVELVRGWPDQVQAKLYDWVINNSPTLRPPATAAELEAEIARLRDRLAAVRAGAADGPKAPPASGAGSS